MNAKTLRTCPECKKKKLKKLISAASFRLKGSGWYQTDFKNSGMPVETPKSDANNNSDDT
jgi:predicted nucleic acid-binding Zn ribbon protein